MPTMVDPIERVWTTAPPCVVSCTSPQGFQVLIMASLKWTRYKQQQLSYYVHIFDGTRPKPSMIFEDANQELKRHR
jgi:hypothetical protein